MCYLTCLWLFFLSLKNIDKFLQKLQNIFEDLPRLYGKNKKLRIWVVSFFLVTVPLSFIFYYIMINVGLIYQFCDCIRVAAIRLPQEVFFFFLLDFFLYFGLILLSFVFFYFVTIGKIFFTIFFTLFIIITNLKIFTNFKSWALTDDAWWYCFKVAWFFLFFSFFFLQVSKIFGFFFTVLAAKHNGYVTPSMYFFF